MDDSFHLYRAKPKRPIISSDSEDEDFLETSETEENFSNKTHIFKPETNSCSTNFNHKSPENDVVSDASLIDSSTTSLFDLSTRKMNEFVLVEDSEPEPEGEEEEAEEEWEEFIPKEKRGELKREKLESEEEGKEWESEEEGEELESEEVGEELEPEEKREEIEPEEEREELEPEEEREELEPEEEREELEPEEEREELEPDKSKPVTHSCQDDSVIIEPQSDKEEKSAGQSYFVGLKDKLSQKISKGSAALVSDSGVISSYSAVSSDSYKQIHELSRFPPRVPVEDDDIFLDCEVENVSSPEMPPFRNTLKERSLQNVSPIENSPPVGTIPKAAAWSSLPTTESDVQNFGKRAMQTHLVQQSLTIETLTTLHSALKACPSEDTYAEDPHGLKVELMPHQKHALAWLMWREREKPSGGILADDMGLGKTLTMISLVLKSQEEEDKENAGESDSDDDDDDGWTDSKRNRMPRGGTLVVCPASLVGQWEKEIKRRCDRGLLSVLLYHGNYRETRVRRIARKDFVITTYNLMSRESGVETAKNCTVLKSAGPLHNIKWKRIILDEAHIVRNHKSLTAMGVFELSGKHRWCLTGTPIQNKELDLFSLMKFLRCSPFDDLAVWKRWVDNKNAAGMQRLSTMMKSLMLRRTKEELQQKGGLQSLPTKNFEIISVKLDSEEMKIYKKVALFSSTLFMQFLGQRAEKYQLQEARYGQSNLPTWEQGDRPDNQFFTDKRIVDMYRKMKMKNTEVKSHQILVLLLRLRQICCHPGLIKEMLEKEDLTGADVEDVGEGGGEDLNEDLFSAMEKLTIDGEETEETEEAVENSLDTVLDFRRPSSKMRAVLDVLLEKVMQSDDKAVVVSQWTSVLNIVYDHLREMGVKCAMLSGSVPIPKRMEMVEDFNNKCHKVKILLLSLTAGGVGLNLVGGNHLFLIDVHWNPALEAQACDRVYRVGQTKPVHVYKFVCSDTVEERIKRLQEIKLSLAESVLTGTTNSQASKLSLQDLKMLFGVGLPQPEF